MFAKEANQSLQNSRIRLGSIDLHDFEVPQAIRFGGRQRLAVHALAGGKRIVERLGPDDDDIRFRGTFSGSTAEARALAFDNLRLSGEIVWLTWESFRRQVVVKSFVADYLSPWWIHYDIACVVVHQTQTVPASVTGVAAALAAGLSSALTMVPGSDISLLALQAALSRANASTTGTADHRQAIEMVESQMSAIDGQIARQSAGLGTGFSSGTDCAALSRDYTSNVNYAHSLAAAVNIRNYVGRIGAILRD